MKNYINHWARIITESQEDFNLLESSKPSYQDAKTLFDILDIDEEDRISQKEYDALTYDKKQALNDFIDMLADVDTDGDVEDDEIWNSEEYGNVLKILSKASNKLDNLDNYDMGEPGFDEEGNEVLIKDFSKESNKKIFVFTSKFSYKTGDNSNDTINNIQSADDLLALKPGKFEMEEVDTKQFPTLEKAEQYIVDWVNDTKVANGLSDFKEIPSEAIPRAIRTLDGNARGFLYYDESGQGKRKYIKPKKDKEKGDDGESINEGRKAENYTYEGKDYTLFELAEMFGIKAKDENGKPTKEFAKFKRDVVAGNFEHEGKKIKIEKSQNQSSSEYEYDKLERIRMFEIIVYSAQHKAPFSGGMDVLAKAIEKINKGEDFDLDDYDKNQRGHDAEAEARKLQAELKDMRKKMRGDDDDEKENELANSVDDIEDDDDGIE